MGEWNAWKVKKKGRAKRSSKTFNKVNRCCERVKGKEERGSTQQKGGKGGKRERRGGGVMKFLEKPGGQRNTWGVNGKKGRVGKKGAYTKTKGKTEKPMAAKVLAVRKKKS